MATRSYELSVVTNKISGKTYYYARSCFKKAKRLSKEDYMVLSMKAFKVDCFYSKNTLTHIRNYKTIYLQA